MDPLYAVVASGATVSGTVDLRQRAITAISVPTITSGDVVPQGGIDTTSAGFLRLLDVCGQAGSGDLRFATFGGSRMIHWPPNFQTPAYARFEMSAAQTDNRTLTILTRPR